MTRIGFIVRDNSRQVIAEKEWTRDDATGRIMIIRDNDPENIIKVKQA